MRSNRHALKYLECLAREPTRGPLLTWGDMALSPQQRRLWEHLIDGEDCAINLLFKSVRPTYETPELRKQHQFVGMQISKINRKLEGSGYLIRCGEQRFSYRLNGVLG